jgi:four helix bundle protein
VSDFKKLGRFLHIALKSTSELEYHLILAREIRAISLSDYESLIAKTIEVRKMLNGLRAWVVASPQKTPRNVPT